MTKGKWTLAVAGMIVAVATTGAVAAPATRPAAQPTTRVAKHKLPKPWSELTDLTPQQQDQVYKLHQDAVAQKKAIDQRAHDDIVALLTPAQRAAVGDVEDQTAAARKEKLAALRKARQAMATTKPSK